MNLYLYPNKVLKVLLIIISTLLLANVIGLISKIGFGHGRLLGFFSLFNFNNEQSIPTLYSSFALVISSLLLGFIGFIHKRFKQPYVAWLGLAAIFLFLSVDEMASIHENLIYLRSVLNTSGYLYYAWVIPYGIGTIIFGIAYLKFLQRLPKKIMNLFILSGAVFISGAIGFELFGGKQADLTGEGEEITLMYHVFYTCEEFLEMLGIVLFIYALLSYISLKFKFFPVLFSHSSQLQTEQDKELYNIINEEKADNLNSLNKEKGEKYINTAS